MFDYEKILYDSLLIIPHHHHHHHDQNPLNYAFKNKHLWVKKATGLGVTEFFLRLMAWLCLRNDDYKTFLGKENRKMSGMYRKDTLQNQILTL